MSKNKKNLFIALIVTTLYLVGCKKEDAFIDEATLKSSEIDSEDRKEPAMILNKETKKEDESKEELVYTELDEKFQVANMYTDPILMNPTKESISVVWFTEDEGSDNRVLLYEQGRDKGPTRRVAATTTKLSRIRGGRTEADCDDATMKRDIYRHEAVVDFLDGNKAYDYCIATDDKASDIYTLKALPDPDEGLKILLTSDLQLKNMSAANIQKVYETVGNVDAVFTNGDIVDVVDRAYDWFDADNAFFRVMQGRAADEIGGVEYQGAKLLQNAPIYAAVGNHDVMGVYSDTESLSYQFNNPTTREYAKEKLGEGADNEKIEDASFNTRTWEEIFTLPASKEGNEKYYAFSFGKIRVIVLEAARIWRLPTVGILSKYSELPGVGKDRYGFGQFIFEPISKGSDQWDFLEKELNSEEYKNADIKMVMYHFDSHSLGGNTIPPFTDPVAKIVNIPNTNQQIVTYDYPKDKDYLLNEVEPLLEESGVDLLFTAHSHLWNRFKTESGMNILQSSNVGNSYNAFLDDEDKRELAPSAFAKNDIYHSIADAWDRDNYVMRGDPGALEPIEPNIVALPANKPYLASNTITAFSILDTERGCIDSYYFDTEKPDSEVVLFDSFSL